MVSVLARVASLALLLLVAWDPARAYNDEQHQGMVALAYKAMTASVLEKGACTSPISFGFGATPPPSLREMPAGLPCDAAPAVCLARWQLFLVEVEKAVVRLHEVNAGLPGPIDFCPDPRGQKLRDVSLAVRPHYGRDRIEGRGCGVDPRDDDGCSSVDHFCEPGSIYGFLASDDHTGDTLGYWATEPDHDKSVVAIGVKPVNAAGGGVAITEINDGLESVATAILIPFACAYEFLFGDGDCLDDAISLADDAVVIDDISSIVPVVAPHQDAALFGGLWHFIQTGTPASNECDDRQGVLYMEAGPGRPDEIDLGFVWFADFFGLTVDYDESEGTRRFSITNPVDGDAASCVRGAEEWELETFPHVPFSPLDNLALWGWRNFADDLPSNWKAEDLGWPLHAIGDAVAPHHLVGTTGWGHRPYEDAAEESWPKILLQDAFLEGVHEAQYEQLRRILVGAFHYSEVFDELRATRPSGPNENEVPIRAFVTRVATDTRAQVFAGAGDPPFPFLAGVSVPYAGPNLSGLGDRAIAKALYGDEISIAGTRALLERGAGAILAFLAEIPRLSSQPVGGPVCGSASEGAFFQSCGAFSECQDGCCVKESD